MLTRRHLLQLLPHLSLIGVSGLSALSLGDVAYAKGNDAKDSENSFDHINFANWSDDEPEYLFYVNDKIEVQIPSAPELNRTTQVAPDGRITLPMIGQIMVSQKSLPQVQFEISSRYAQYLRRPNVSVFPGDVAAIRVLVGGEVKNAGWIDMVGDMDALSAVLAAGGLTHAARSKKIVLIRRSQDGRPMKRIIDIDSPISGKNGRLYALRRNDIVFVPRTKVAEAGVFVEQYINNLIPGAVLNYFTYQVFGR